jgi:glycosyltransferase involved in cell wall biosynthesis
VIIADDASDPPLDPEALRRIWRRDPDRLTLLRQETQRGAGAARNLALDHVTGSHVLFFDSDDMLTPELPWLLHDLKDRDFDFCLFRHHDSRVGLWGRSGQMPSDEAHWRDAGVAVGALSRIQPSQATRLAGIINYPWNKIYRNEFLQAHAIRCSQTPVHNDIEIHWLSFLHAKDILVSDRVAARHFVAAAGNRLTNRSGAERLSVFQPLERIATRLSGKVDDIADHPLLAEFLRFASSLFDWIRGFLNTTLRAEFENRTRGFLLRHVPPATFARLAHADPVLALRINHQLARGKS